MIFSRFIRNMKGQHWLAFFIDFVIVVVGVFVGIQASNWNKAQAGKRLGAEYVQRLAADLRGDLVKAHEQAAYYANVLQAVQRTAKLLKAPDPDPRELVISAYRATEVIYQAPNEATWDQIVSSGRLELLPRGAVDGGLAQYYSYNVTLDGYKLLNSAPYRKIVRSIIPISVQAAIRAGCSDVRDSEGFAYRFRKTCNVNVPPALLRSTAQALRADPEVAGTLRYQYSLLASGVPNFKAVIVIIKKALAALGASEARAGSRP